MTSVSIVSCIYGDGYEKFLDHWEHAISLLVHPASEVILVQSTHPSESRRNVQAALIDQGIKDATSEWIWRVDVDDRVISTGLLGINEVDAAGADVWQFGYQRGDGFWYAPPQLSNDEYLALDWNPYSGCSAFRKSAYLDVGGYPDVNYEDWALWRRMALAGKKFISSNRAHYLYLPNPQSRSTLEFEGNRERLRAEMLGAE